MTPFLFGFVDSINLLFASDFSFKLINRSELINQEPSGRGRGINILVNDLQFHFFLVHRRFDLVAARSRRKATKVSPFLTYYRHAASCSPFTPMRFSFPDRDVFAVLPNICL